MLIKTLKGQLHLWAVLLILVPSLMLMSVYTAYEIRSAKQDTMNILSQQTFFAEQLINEWLSLMSGHLRYLGQEEAFIIGDFPQIDRHLRLVQNINPEFDSLIYADKNGVVRSFTSGDWGQRITVADRQYFQDAIAGKRYISDVIVGRANGDTLVAISAPCYDLQGKISGVVIGYVQVAMLERFLRTNWVGETDEMFLVNGNGMMLTEPRYVDVLIEKGLVRNTARMQYTITEDALRNINLQATGTARWTDYLGNIVLGSYRNMPERGWTIIGKVKEAEVLGPIYRQLARMTAAVLVAVLLILPMSIMISNRIRRPIDWLVEQVEKMADQNDHPVDLQEEMLSKIPNELKHLCDTFIDMRQKIETAIRINIASEAKMKEAQHIARVGSWEWDLERGALYWSDQIYRNLGLNKEEHRPDMDLFLSLVHPSDRERVQSVINGCLTAGFGAMDYRIVRPNGDEAWLHGEVRSMTNASGNGVLMRATQQDITGRKRNEEQLERYADELAASNSELRSFSYIVSHDLRSPLVNLKGFSQELEYALGELNSIIKEVTMPEDFRRSLDVLLQEDVPEALGFINLSVDRMDRMIAALLKLSRLGRRELDYKDVNMNSLFKMVLNSFVHQTRLRNIKVTIEPLPVIFSDYLGLEQIVSNLLDNAIKYLDQDRPGEIRVYSSENSDEYIFTVQDNGGGICPEDQEKIFNIFGRAGKQDVPGEGMGLAYVKTLIRQLGGKVYCQSELGTGTKMSFTVPKI